MDFVGWMYDIAREQAPRMEQTRHVLQRSLQAGYDAVGFYLEHRFAYASAPWAADTGVVTPEFVRALRAEFQPAGLRLIPFLNTLGHMEGFTRTVTGRRLAEGSRFGTEQICPLHPDTPAFVRGLIDDAAAAFDDEWLHLGGDEPWQLGSCPRCAERVRAVGLAGLYGEYYRDLCTYVIQKGRRPGLWADMANAHPDVLDYLPRETILFDWQYDADPAPTTAKLRSAGFDVICCPALHTYNAAWCFLERSRQNVVEHAAAAKDNSALGVLLTTWEFSALSQYRTVFPLIWAFGRVLRDGRDLEYALEQEAGANWARAADIIGNELPATSAFLAPGTWRTLRDRLILRQNPFELWRDWREEACGEVGNRILALCDRAARLLEPADPLHVPITLHRLAIEFVNRAEFARQAYDEERWDNCLSHLENAQRVLAGLIPLASGAEVIGGSIADRPRANMLMGKIDRAIQRIEKLRQIADDAEERAGGPLPRYRPAFEVVVSDGYIERDQAAWRTGMRD
jgi:hypothetical protein